MTIKINGTNTTAQPSITGTDTDTGLVYGTDEVSIVTGGTTQTTVDSSGRLLVGTSSETGSSTVVVRGRPGLSAAEGQLELGRNQPATTPFGSGDPLGKILFTDNGSNVYGQIVCEADGTSASGDYPGRLVFAITADGASTPTERLRIQSGGGISFNGDTAAANALDDYEEGTWTPAITSSGYVLSTASGYYTKIGNLVSVHFQVRFSTIGTNNASAAFTGLPYNSSSAFHHAGVCRESSAYGDIFVVQVSAGNPNIAINSMDGVVNNNNAPFATGRNYNAQLTYFV